MYSNTSNSMNVNNYLTDWFVSEHGVRQGDALSPTLFSLFINDLISELKNTNVGVKIDNVKICILAYADDLVVFADNEHDLQYLLNILYNWCRKWRLQVNYDKTKIVHFRGKNVERTDYNFKCGNNKLEIVHQYKYLGVVLDEYLDYKTTTEILASSAGRALGSVINKVKSNKDLGFQTYTTLYNNCVAPVMDYGSGVWGRFKFKHCEDVQLRACRYYLGIHRLAPIPGIVGDTGWYNCDTRWKIEIIRFYNRLLYMDNNRLTKRIYQYDRCILKNNWCSYVKNLLVGLDMSANWEDEIPVDINTLKEKLYDIAHNDWEHSVLTKPKLRTYSLIKHNFICEPYISCNLSKNVRSLICQLRLGILPLRIETGRYVQEPVPDRKCLLCKTNSVEDETHFLFQCDAYDFIRDDMYPEMRQQDFINKSAAEKFVHVFNNPYKLGKYLTKLMLLRKNCLYKCN